MSLPSYKLSRGAGGSWFAEGVLPSGRPFKIDVGKGSRDRAEGITEIKLRGKLASSKGSRDRWAKFHRERAAAKASSAGGAPAAEGVRAPNLDASVDTSTSAPHSPKRDHAAIRAKLLSLGDSQPIDDSASASSSSSSSSSSAEAGEPDRVIPPGAPREADEDPIDDEGGELIAGLLAKGTTLALVALANAPLKKRKPPQRGEPHEKGLEWFNDGLEVQYKKLVGKTATLGPTGKIIAGGIIIVASIYMTAEPIEGAAADTPPPAPASTAEGSTANGQQQHADPETALAPVGLRIGVFGKERN